MTTPPSAILCVLAASLLGAAGQFLFKAAAARPRGSPLGFLLSPWALAGMLCYLSIMVLFNQAFKRGGTVSVLYPIYATTFIWAALAAHFRERPLQPVHVAGMALLVAGMYCMGR